MFPRNGRAHENDYDSCPEPALVIGSTLGLAVSACSNGADSKRGDTTAAPSAQAPNSGAPVVLRGAVVSVSPTELVLKSDTGVVTVKVVQPFHVYARVPSDIFPTSRRQRSLA